METTIVKIGNSQGLIIPKKLLSSLGEGKKFDMQLKDGGLFIVPCEDNTTRSDWEAQFTSAIQNGYKPDTALEDLKNEFDIEDWTW